MPCPAEASVSELPLLGVLSRVSRDWWLNCNVRVQHSAFEFSCQRVFSRGPGRRRQQAGGSWQSESIGQLVEWSIGGEAERRVNGNTETRRQGDRGRRGIGELGKWGTKLPGGGRESRGMAIAMLESVWYEAGALSREQLTPRARSHGRWDAGRSR